MLEVEVLEVSRNKLLDLGLRFPESIAWSLVGAGGTPGTAKARLTKRLPGRISRFAFAHNAGIGAGERNA